MFLGRALRVDKSGYCRSHPEHSGDRNLPAPLHNVYDSPQSRTESYAELPRRDHVVLGCTQPDVRYNFAQRQIRIRFRLS